MEKKWTDEDMTDFALFIGNNLNKFKGGLFKKGKTAEEILEAYKKEINYK